MRYDRLGARPSAECRETLCTPAVVFLCSLGAVGWWGVLTLEMRPPRPPPPADDLTVQGATDWKVPFGSSACVEALRREQALMRSFRRTYGFYCKRRPLLYSPSTKLAYLKTPKAASISIQELFQQQFTDSTWVTTQEALPADVLVFTFSREPVSRVIAAYAEIDVAYARKASKEKRAEMNTTFHRLAQASPEQGERRFLAFLDDLLYHRFGGDDREHWAPTHAYPQLNFACKQTVHYIGRLENQDIDWQRVQALVGIPIEERTQIPRAHETKQEECSKVHACFYKEMDKNVSKSSRVLQRVCDTYSSDFACLGYKRPAACSPSLRSAKAATQSRHSVPNGSTSIHTLPAGKAADAAPVHSVKFTGKGVFGHFLWMVKQPEYQNSLFLFNDDVENHSTAAAVHQEDPTGLSGNGDASLRQLNRYGWLSKRGALGFPLVAPLSAGIPTQKDRHGFDKLSVEVRSLLDAALNEVAQLLLIHQYDHVFFCADVFAKGAKVLTDTFGVHPSVVAYIQQRLQKISDPLNMLSAPAVANVWPTVSKYRNNESISS